MAEQNEIKTNRLVVAGTAAIAMFVSASALVLCMMFFDITGLNGKNLVKVAEVASVDRPDCSTVRYR